MTALIAVVVMHNLNNEFVVLTLQGLTNSVPDLHIVTYIRWVAIRYHLIQILQWKQNKDNQYYDMGKKFICLPFKLVCMEWSESKSELKFWIQYVDKPPVQIFGAIRATSGAFKHIVISAWWHGRVILNTSTMKLYIKTLNFISFHFHFTYIQHHLSQIDFLVVDNSRLTWGLKMRPIPGIIVTSKYWSREEHQMP